jgi:hypothetical protein
MSEKVLKRYWDTELFACRLQILVNVMPRGTVDAAPNFILKLRPQGSYWNSRVSVLRKDGRRRRRRLALVDPFGLYDCGNC